MSDHSAEAESRLAQTFVFSRECKLVKRVQFLPGRRRPVTQEFFYDENGRRETWVARDHTGATLWQYRYRYNEQGRLIQETEFDRDGHVAGQRAFLYHEENGTVRVEESAYDAFGAVLWWMQSVRSTNARDAAADEEWTVFFPDGRTITEGIRRYDHRERIVYEEEIDRTTDTRITKRYEYGARDRPTRIERRNSDDEILRVEEYRYDRQGNPVFHRTRIIPDDYHLTRRFEYRYDEYGNWIRRVGWSVVTTDGRLETVEQNIRVRRYEYWR